MNDKPKNYMVALIALALFLGGFSIGAGICTAYSNRILGNVQGELDSARQSLESARLGGIELERRLGEITELASVSAKSVDGAIAQAGRISDSVKRIQYIIGAIKEAAHSLYNIVDAGKSPIKY